MNNCKLYINAEKLEQVDQDREVLGCANAGRKIDGNIYCEE